jgi:16S rRNA pseudouridine516 synthase
MLLFTNDGDLCYEMTHPDKKFKKTYYAELDREIKEEDLVKLREGIVIDNYQCLPAEVEQIDSKKIYLTITEGKYHQVKKMLKAVKNKVIYLKRIKFGNLELGNMFPGEVREIIKQDILN